MILLKDVEYYMQRVSSVLNYFISNAKRFDRDAHGYVGIKTPTGKSFDSISKDIRKLSDNVNMCVDAVRYRVTAK